MDITQIKEIIPHRYPFLLVDKIKEMEIGKRAVGQKNVTANEEFFNGHFPNKPVMPGVLIIEALAQVGAVAILAREDLRGKIPYFAGINSAKFKRQVVPGDVLELDVEFTRFRGRAGVARAIARVDGQLACEAELMFMVGDN